MNFFIEKPTYDGSVPLVRQSLPTPPIECKRYPESSGILEDGTSRRASLIKVVSAGELKLEVQERAACAFV